MADGEDKQLNGVKSLLRSVLMGAKEGVPAVVLQREYKELVGEYVPFKKLGFPRLEDFIMTVPDVVQVRRSGSEYMFHAVADAATAHIQALVSKQRSKKKLKRPVRRPGGGGARFLPRRNFTAAPRPRAPLITPAPRTQMWGAQPTAPRPPRPPPPLTQNRGRVSPENILEQRNHMADARGLASMTVMVGASHTGTRTVKVGNERYGPLLDKAMRSVATDRLHERQSVKKYQMPPRFKKRHWEPQTQKVDPAPAQRIQPASNFNENLPHQKKDNKPPPSLPNDGLQLVKDRVKEIIAKKRNGLWGTVIPHEYKERFKIDPPPDLIQLIKQWPDVATVEFVANTDRDIVYPVEEDANKPKPAEPPKKEALTIVVTGTAPKSPTTSPEGRSRKSPGVKDLIDLHEETVYRQTEFRETELKLKALVIPKVDLLTQDHQVVYMTYIHNPGYFCVQLETSTIDTISEQLQAHCASRPAPSFKELQKGQFCAGIYSADDQWTRAEILQVKESQELVELLFIDYGNVEAVGAQAVRWLSPELAEVPIQAINCSLYGIEPIKEEVEWSKKATMLFATEVQDQALIAIPQLVYDDLVDIELFLQSDLSISLNQKLAELGVVKTASETQVEGQAQESTEPALIVLPEEKHWDVHITYISATTNSVMLRLVGEDYSERLDQYESRLQEAFRAGNSDAPFVDGANYITFDEGYCHRVRALAHAGDKVTCYFLDYGDTAYLQRSQLRPLPVDLNKTLPYQAVEVCLCGLEDVATNMTALKKLCDLALGRTCVSEAVERDVVPSVVLFDTSTDEDVNINEAILRAIDDDAGSIDSPRTQSPHPSSTPQRVRSPAPSSTPQQVMSPAPSTTSLTEKDSQSSNNTSPRVPFNSDSTETIVHRSPRQDSDLDDDIAQQAVSKTPKSNVVPYIPPTPESPTSPSSPVPQTSPYVPPHPHSPADSVLISNMKTLDLAKDESLLAETSVIRTRSDETHMLPDSISANSPYTSNWMQLSSNEPLPTGTTVLESNQNTDKTISSTSNDTQNIDSNLPNENANVDHATEEVTNENVSSGTKDLLQPGRLIWNPTEYAKRPLPPNYQLPGVGDYIDIHVNFTNDPSNFICIPYQKQNELQQLLLDMIAYFCPAPPPVKKEDLVEGQLYAGHKDSMWYRVKLCKFVGNDLMSVLLVDMGEYSVLTLSEVQPLPWTFWKLPLLAFTAKLGSVQPVTGSWSEAAKYKFTDLTLDKDLIGLVQDLDPKTGVISLRLIDTNGEIDICIDEILVAKKFATFIN